ncbi:alkaline phosphatase [Chryseobacterium caseinilyticum]|uniref:Alkaline phosphatase n=1 Tax=Chryseobacterium caseinilyticum TaxID=2771428 RepID=A0ABR8ZFX4_9FLAO|nr:alkaline phosphatase [Chryseobacterium caseinilyticum]MBD8084188.1 alkaline phosphatase [Chryseobacterium caseinilyticum]
MNYHCKNLNLKALTAVFMLLIESLLTAQSQKPINVIFMIGDGMGVSQVTSAFYFGEGKPNFQNFKFVGLSETSSTSDRITDSAAGATALSTGKKTYKRAIGVDKDSLAIPTILEQLQDKGYKTGLVSLTSLTHATPAAYYAHIKDRDWHEDIALDFIKSDVDFAAAGGLKFFNKRKDQKNLLNDLLKKQYRIDTVSLSKPVIGKRNLYLLAEDELPNKIQGRKDFLPEATQTALDYFSAEKKPFFLMVEGSFIDWGGHATNAEMMVKEVLDFDKTIGVVMEFIKKNPNTLLVVTADHETGGASIGKFMEKDTATGKKKEVKDKVQVNFIDNQHTAALVPVFAMGKGQELFSGVYPNNTIYHKLVEALKKSGVAVK